MFPPSPTRFSIFDRNPSLYCARRRRCGTECAKGGPGVQRFRVVPPLCRPIPDAPATGDERIQASLVVIGTSRPRHEDGGRDGSSCVPQSNVYSDARQLRLPDPSYTSPALEVVSEDKSGTALA